MAVVFSPAVIAQGLRKPLDPSKARTSYSFPVHSGWEPFRFQVHLDDEGRVNAVSIFRASESNPFQTLSSCDKDLNMALDEYDDERDLLNHADLNFDGFEDLELLREFDSHNGTSVYCIYVWDQKEGRFRHEPEIPNINPVPDSASKTIFVHQDWQGGPYSDTRYRWNGAKLEVVEVSGKLYGSDDPDCAFTDYCGRLIGGKVVTVRRKSGCSDRPDVELVCPQAPVRSPAGSAPRKE
jgi:hypothetical protein